MLYYLLNMFVPATSAEGSSHGAAPCNDDLLVHSYKVTKIQISNRKNNFYFLKYREIIQKGG